jgi:hypothetical protein
VSDNDIDAEQQLKELDGMNKYLQNVRVPTSKLLSLTNTKSIEFLGDDYLEANRTDAERAYTLQRLREEERILGSDRERDGLNLSNSSSTYEVVEEMYDQMNSFETRLKNKQY